jgi:hypothetical protein
LPYCVYLRRDGAIAGVGNLEEAQALIDRFADRNPVVIEGDAVVEKKWMEDKREASMIVGDKLLALDVARRIKETGEPFPHLKTTVERVTYLLGRYPELRNPRDSKGKFTRQPQTDLYETVFPGSQGDTARRAFAYVQNTLQMYPPDEETRMWQVYTQEQFREFFAAKNAEEFRQYAETAARVVESGTVALVE